MRLRSSAECSTSNVKRKRNLAFIFLPPTAGVVGADYESGSGAFGDGDSVKCDGSEVSIFQCSLDLDFAFNNSLAESASVTCQGIKFTIGQKFYTCHKKF